MKFLSFFDTFSFFWPVLLSTQNISDLIFVKKRARFFIFKSYNNRPYTCIHKYTYTCLRAFCSSWNFILFCNFMNMLIYNNWSASCTCMYAYTNIHTYVLPASYFSWSGFGRLINMIIYDTRSLVHMYRTHVGSSFFFLNLIQSPDVCMYVCMYVCMCMCV